MGEPVRDSTHVRCLSYGLVRRLAELIDPQEGWKKLAVDITNPAGESRYSQAHIRSHINAP
uniref:IRAK4 n=1 Tax=Zosterops lateralis melanops TaxID=1220523 RepID=A0A8D2NLU5_ZOSLA